MLKGHDDVALHEITGKNPFESGTVARKYNDYKKIDPLKTKRICFT